jgi:hypothetical protein
MINALFLLCLLFAAAPGVRGTEFTLGAETKHPGEADGSAGIPAGKEHFICATDENNSRRVYPVLGGSAGKVVLELNPLLGFSRNNDGVFRESVR